MRLKKGFVLRNVAGETIVVPTGSDLDLNMMITLNDSGKFLWEKLEQGAEEAELVAAVL
jgi:sensor domain CHASE-containing protein